MDVRTETKIFNLGIFYNSTERQEKGKRRDILSRKFSILFIPSHRQVYSWFQCNTILAEEKRYVPCDILFQLRRSLIAFLLAFSLCLVLENFEHNRAASPMGSGLIGDWCLAAAACPACNTLSHLQRFMHHHRPQHHHIIIIITVRWSRNWFGSRITCPIPIHLS